MGPMRTWTHIQRAFVSGARQKAIHVRLTRRWHVLGVVCASTREACVIRSQGSILNEMSAGKWDKHIIRT